MQLKRCYINLFNASRDIIGNITYSKARGAGDIQSSYSVFAFNSITGFAEGIMDFDDKIWSDKLAEGLYQQGAACITILTFQHNDNNQSAGTALARVWKAAKAPGFDLITRGECNARLLAKAKEIMAEDEKAEAAEHAFDAKTQAVLKESLQELKENMVTKGDLARVGEALATKDDLTKIDETVDEMSLKMATKEDLNNMVTKEDLTSMITKEDLSKVEESMITKDDLVITQDELKRMRERAEHAEHLSFVLRGQLGAEDSKKVRSLRKEVELGKKENEKLKRQMADRDRMEAEKDQKLQERLNDIGAGIERMEKRLKFMEERDSLREERESRLLEILGRMEEELDALSTRDLALGM